VNIPPRFPREDLHHRRRKDHESRFSTEIFLGVFGNKRIDNLGLATVCEYLGDRRAMIGKGGKYVF
jgi:hypothetical protein